MSAPQETVEPTMSEDPRTLVDTGLAASMANRPQQALRLLMRATEVAPGWALPHFLLGSELAAQGQMPAAEAALAQAVLIDPAMHLARYQLGLLQFSSGRATAALVTWQPLSLQEGLQGLPAFVRGFAAMAHDAFDEAHGHFCAGLEDPEVNAAVAGDIRKVLTELDTLSQPRQAAQPELNPTGHVLVAAYDKNRLH